MLNKSVAQSGLILGGITLFLFFALYFTYTNFNGMSDRHYFSVSAIIICFVLPLLYTSFGFYQILKQAKKKPQTFRQGFRLSFIPQFIGGALSTIFIFIFFSTIGIWAQENLKQEWLNLRTEQIQNADIDLQEKAKLLKEIKTFESYQGNIFSFVQFIKFFPLLILFYIIISAILAMFMKNRQL